MRAVWIVALVGLFSATAAAQQDVFRDALIRFHASLAGEKGDEGPVIAAELERMNAALGAWTPLTTAPASARPNDSAIDDPVRAYEEKRVDVLLAMLDRRLQSVPSDRHLELFPETALVPDRAAVTPVFAPALYADGFSLIEQRRYREALASFRQAVARDPLVIGGPAEAHRIHDSLDELEAAVRLAPDDERARVALGRKLASVGQRDRAEQVLLETVRRLPKSADAHSALADLYEDLGRGQDALREVEAVASFTVPAGKAGVYFRLADLYHRFLQYDRVIDPLARRVALIPNDARAHTDLGLALARIGRDEDALVELVVASLLGPDDTEALAAIGQIHFDNGKYAAAETVLRRAIAKTPAFPQPHYVLGQTLARLGRARESELELAEFSRLRANEHDDTRRLFETEQKLSPKP